jgi:hypothetical protein
VFVIANDAIVITLLPQSASLPEALIDDARRESLNALHNLRNHEAGSRDAYEMKMIRENAVSKDEGLLLPYEMNRIEYRPSAGFVCEYRCTILGY